MQIGWPPSGLGGEIAWFRYYCHMQLSCCFHACLLPQCDYIFPPPPLSCVSYTSHTHDTDALEIISSVASHVNETIRQMVRPKLFMERRFLAIVSRQQDKTVWRHLCCISCCLGNHKMFVSVQSANCLLLHLIGWLCLFIFFSNLHFDQDNFRKVIDVRKKLIGNQGDTLITPYRVKPHVCTL